MIKKIIATVMIATALVACQDNTGSVHRSSEPEARMTAEEFQLRLAQLEGNRRAINPAFIYYLSNQATPYEREQVKSQLPSLNWYQDRFLRRNVEAIYPAYFHEFMRYEQVTLFIGVRNDHAMSDAIRANLITALPPHVRLSDNPFMADMRLTYTKAYSNTDEIEKSRKHQDKKYPKKYRKDKIAKCQQLERGHYTEIKKELEASYSYRLTLSIRGTLVDGRDYTGRTDVSYKIGKKLLAETPCDTRPTVKFPSNSVRRLFNATAQKRIAKAELKDRIARNLASRARGFHYPLRSQL